MRTIVFIDITDIDVFVKELKSRRIHTVRQSTYREYPGGGLESRFARFTAWDPGKAEILRLDVKYWGGHYLPQRPEAEEKKIADGLVQYVVPLANHILHSRIPSRRISISNGEYGRD